MAKSNPLPKRNAGFVESMECLPVAQLPEGPQWTYEIKLDGYRLQVVRDKGDVTLYSRKQNVLNRKFHYIATALNLLPNGIVLDGELVALAPSGHADFNLLQSFRTAESHVIYYAFDILVHKNRDLMQLPLSERRVILRSVIEPNEHVGLSEVSNKSSVEMLKFVKQQGLEGVVAKRSDSFYEPGERSGLWTKHTINLGQEFVVGGYVPSNLGVDALIVGFYRGKDLMYSARVRGGLVPASRRELFNKIKHLATQKCPFVNLPELGDGRWGRGLTAEKMKECLWIRPEAVVRIEFLQWTGADHLRHAKFIALRYDKDPHKVVKETSSNNS